jgi:hypothetical protein
MPAKKKRPLPEAFIANTERMKAGEIQRKSKPKKTTRQSSSRKPRK